MTFHDAKPIVPAEEVTTFTRRHVAIDRKQGTQFGGALMTVEAVPGDGLTFAGLVTFINPDPWMVGAVRETLHLLQYAGVGARKSRGYGDLIVTLGTTQFVIHPASEKQTEAAYQSSSEQAWKAKRGGVTLELSAQPADTSKS